MTITTISGSTPSTANSLTTIADPAASSGGALIGYNNLLIESTFSTGELALTPNTYERLTSASGATTIKFQMASPSAVDYIAIAAHNLSGENIQLSTAATIGGALTEVADITPTNNQAIFQTFDSATIEEIAITSTFSTAIEIGSVYAGEALQMPRSIYGGHSPIDLSPKTEFHSNISETGQFLGRGIIRKGTKTNLSWKLLDDAWYRSDFLPFAQASRTTPFFIKWRPDYYSEANAFCFATADIRPSNMGGGTRHMQVNVPVMGHDDI